MKSSVAAVASLSRIPGVVPPAVLQADFQPQPEAHGGLRSSSRHEEAPAGRFQLGLFCWIDRASISL